jgi:predicted RNA-binding Zn-ribbon protein involved in translation (DUF1610 family)
MCGKSLAVYETAVGRKFNCTSCNSKVKIPEPLFFFSCPSCSSGLGVTENTRGGIFYCPDCQKKIAAPLADPSMGQKAGETEGEKKDPGPGCPEKEAPGKDTVPAPVLNKSAEYVKKQNKLIVERLGAFREKKEKDKRKPLFKALKVLAGIFFICLVYFFLSRFFHPKVVAGLMVLALMIIVPLILKARWLMGD